MAKLSWTLRPKPPNAYSADELRTLIERWGSIRWAANAIGISESGFRNRLKKDTTP